MGKMFKKLVASVLVLTILATFCAVPMSASAEDNNLKFGSDGKFKIVVFADVQVQYPTHQRLLNVMRQAIEREKPDLIVFTGDQTEINTKDAEVDFRRALTEVLSPVVEAGIPYAFTFGNHDIQGSNGPTNMEAILSVYQSIGDCRTYDAEPSLTGTGTCKIPIYSNDGSKVAFNLWMVDSGSYQNPADYSGGYGCPQPDQLAWMKANNDAGVNSLVFQHIPMPEIYNLIKEDPNGEKSYGGKTYKMELVDGATGNLNEFPHPCPADKNAGEFQTLKEMGNVLGVFTGHDHYNNFTGTYEGIDMTAVPGMTYFAYGKEEYRGYGVIELDENNLSDYSYNSVMFSTLDEEAGNTSTSLTYDVYDEITYADLKQNGSKLGSAYVISGGHTFTYDATSPSYSAVFKFRWTAGSKPGFQFSFDEGDSGNISNPFGVWVKRADQAEPYGAWHFKPSSEAQVPINAPVAEGNTYDIELGRLKVIDGPAQAIGQYYVYLKVNGVLIKDSFTNTNAEGLYMSGNAVCQVSNKIRFGGWGNGGDDKISEIPVVEEYEDYDYVTYYDMIADGSKLPAEEYPINTKAFTYDKTSATGSVIVKYRWKAANSGSEFQLGLDTNDAFAYMFGMQYYKPNEEYPNGRVWLRPGMGPSVELEEAIENGKDYDIEFARLKVKNGKNKGKYYLYVKLNGKLIAEDYVDASVVDANGNYTSAPNDKNCTISNNIYLTFWGGGGGNKISPIPEAESYYAYDDLSFNDLYIGDMSMNGKEMDGSHNYTYNATSPSYSMKLKYRWTAGGDTLKFTTFLDDWKYPFCFAAKSPNQADFGAAAGENGAWHLVPSNSSQIVQMDEPIVAGQSYDIEVGRLKVRNGANKNKYYVYFKVDGELIQSYYYDGVVDGVYDGVALSNKIIISAPAGNLFTASPVVEEPDVEEPDDNDSIYDSYDVVTYDKLTFTGSGSAYTYNATSSSFSSIIKFRWTAGGAQKKFTLFLDDWVFPFCFSVKTPNQDDFGAAAGENGAWHLVPSNSGHIVQMDKPIADGEIYDIEFARLLVTKGEHAGKYHVYAKVNGELIKEYYYAGVIDGMYDGVALSNKVIISLPEGNTISASPNTDEPDDNDSIYDSYDVVTYDKLTFTGSGSAYTYNATSSSFSSIIKFRWTAGGNEKKFTLFLDDWVYPFCFAVKTPNQEGFGEAAGENGAWHLVPSNSGHIVQMDKPIADGEIYDIEFARLLVTKGEHAGKYHVYVKVNGELIKEYYYAGVIDGAYDGVALSNKVIISLPEGNTISASPNTDEPENPTPDIIYYDYDEIGFEDLMDADGNALGNQKQMAGGTTLTYNKTSATGSVILKYRWKVGSVPKFQMSFEKTADDAMAYMFGAWLSAPGEEANYPKGRMWLRPAYGPQVELAEVLAVGSSHNIEFARLKVKSGANAGKYHVYIKIDDVLIAEDYVSGSVVDEYGNYTTDPGQTNVVLSNEIFFAFWGSEGNILSAYRDLGASEHEGIRGDLDNDGVINAVDLVIMKKVLFGSVNVNELTEGVADFNKDGNVDILDLVTIKNYLLPEADYNKTGSLTLGMQEHFLEDETKTAEYIADASATMGATAYRLSEPIHNLYYATETNNVAVKADNMKAFEEMVAALKAKGITEILYVTDSYILPYGYADPEKNHNITIPDPMGDTDNYIAWLTVNAAAFKELAKKFPEIKFFEPFNEINLSTTRFERYGIGWNASSTEQVKYKFTVKEKAGIMADLCYYVSEAVKSVDSANQVTTPSIAIGSNSIIENNFMDEFYKAIESGAYPTGKALGDKRVDNYFTIVNIHAYPDYADSNFQNKVNDWANRIISVYDVVKAHNDGGSRVWITETGMSTYHSDGKARNEQRVATIIGLALEKLDKDLTFVDAVYFYKIADISTDKGASPSETYFGLFYSGDDLDNDPYAAKPSAKTIYSFFHNGTTDYSALTALANRYAD